MNRKARRPYMIAIYLVICIVLIVSANPQREMKEVSVPILMYHHVSEDGGNYAVTPDKLRQDLLELQAAGYTTIFFDELIAYGKGESTLPDKPVIITFDDGYRSNYEKALPIFEELDMKGEISIVVSAVNEGSWTFGWDEARELEDSGHIMLRCHTFDMHEYKEDGNVARYGVLKADGESLKEWKKVFTADVEAAEEAFSRELGHHPLVYTYPYGSMNRYSEKILKENGYLVTLGIEKGINEIRFGKSDDLYKLYRIGVDHYDGSVVDKIGEYL